MSSSTRLSSNAYAFTQPLSLHTSTFSAQFHASVTSVKRKTYRSRPHSRHRPHHSIVSTPFACINQNNPSAASSDDNTDADADADANANVNADVNADVDADGLANEKPSPVIRDLPVIALSMTAGNDILFPGCYQTLKLNEETHAQLQQSLDSEMDNTDHIPGMIVESESDDVSENENDELNGSIIEFAYITLNAWGDPSTVGTIAIIEHYNKEGMEIICSGITRFRVHELSDDMKTARIEIFTDDRSEVQEDIDKIDDLERQLVSAMTDIVNLTIKINNNNDDNDNNEEYALKETLKRVELFYTQQHDEQNQNEKHWMMELTPDLRRELLSFIVIDMLSVSFMDRKTILQSTDTAERLEQALQGLQPYVKELAAKGAIVGALGKNNI